MSAGGSSAQSFLERFVLSTDRRALLKEMVPDTPEFYQYSILTAQLEVMERTAAGAGGAEVKENAAALKEIDALIVRAQQSHKVSGSVTDTYKLRQRLLRYHTDEPKEQEETTKELMRHLSVTCTHSKRVERHEAVKQNYPTALPADISAAAKCMETAYRNQGGATALQHRDIPAVQDWLSAQKMDKYQLSDFLNAVSRPIVPGLPQLIVKDMKEQKSTFGSRSVHNTLTQQQLKELLSLDGSLATQLSFAVAQLRKTQPENVELLDAKQKAEFYDHTWKYALQLPQQFNGLKGTLMQHVLRFETKQLLPAPLYDMAKFQQFAELPRNSYPYNNRFSGPEYKLLTVHWANQGVGAGVLSGIYDESELAREYVTEWLRTQGAANGFDVMKQFGKYLNESWLLSLRAEVLLLLNGARVGKADAKQYAEYVDRLGSSTVQALRARVDLEFDPRPNVNRPIWSAADDVRLKVWTKNVPTLTVKLFKIQAKTYYQQQLREVDASISLDGLTAWQEDTYKFDDADPLQRVTRTLEFPKLKGLRGVFVVELLGNGKFSRAVLRKGQLTFVEHQSERGHMFRLLDGDTNTPLPEQAGGSVWIGNHTYAADAKTGVILVPFASANKYGEVMLLSDSTGELTSLVRFNQMSESYTFSAAMYVDRESLLSKSQSELLIRPALYLNGHPLTNLLRPVKKTVLRLTTTNDEGVRTSQVCHDFKLSEKPNADTVHPFTVPDNVRRIEFALELELRVASTGATQNVSSSVSYALNGIEDTERVDDLHLRYGSDGYSVVFLGKAGEARPHVRISFTLYHTHVVQPIRIETQTDEAGRVALGPLPHIERVDCNAEHSSAQGSWRIGVEKTYNTARTRVHAVEGELVRIPYFGDAQGTGVAANPKDFALMELRHGTYQADLTTTNLEVSGEERSVVVKGLKRGMYQLIFKEFSASRVAPVDIVVAKGNVVMGTYVTEEHRLVELRSRDVSALQISSAKLADGGKFLDVQLSQWGLAPRVHVFASHFYPEYSVIEQLRNVRGVSPITAPINRLESLYYGAKALGDEQQYILDRKLAKKYTGNMLPRPSLLLNERVRQTTSFDADPTVRAGEAFAAAKIASAAYGGARGDMMEERRAMAKERSAGANTIGSHNLEFLSDGSVRLLNLVPDDNGLVRIERAKFGPHHSHVLVMAVDGHSSVVVTRVGIAPVSAPLPAAAAAAAAGADAKDQKGNNTLPLHPAYTDIRLIPGLTPGKHFTEQHLISVMSAGDAKQVDDIRQATVETYETLGDVWALYNTLAKDKGGNATSLLNTFNFVMKWPSLPDDVKAERYSEYSCHELNFFLYHKDRAFFESHVRPFLKDKLTKTFLDRWFLGMDVSRFTRAFEFSRLNALEQILLAATEPGKAAALAQWQVDKAALQTKDPQQFIALFKTAILSRALDAAEKGKSTVPKQTREGERAAKADLAKEYAASEEVRVLADLKRAPPKPIAALGGKGGGGGFGGGGPGGGARGRGGVSASRSSSFAAKDACDDDDGAEGGESDASSGSDDEDQLMAKKKSKKKVAAPQKQKRRAMKEMAAEEEEADGDGDDMDRDMERNMEKEKRSGRADKADAKSRRGPSRRAEMGDDEWGAADEAGGAAPPRRLFQAPPTTKELEERNYYDVPSDDTSRAAGLIALNPFWADYAAHIVKRNAAAAAGDAKAQSEPFLSSHLAYPNANFTEMLMALAVIDLPFAAGKHEVTAGRVQFRFKAATPAVLFHREVKETEAMLGSGSSMSVTQSYFDPAEPYEEQTGPGGERMDKYLGSEFLPGRVYGCRTVLTNVSSANQTVSVLKQLPAGAVGITKYGRQGTARAFVTRTDFVTVSSFSTYVFEFFFYFPGLGQYNHYPVQVSKLVHDKATGASATKVIGAGALRTMQVVGKPTTPPDTASWRWISQHADAAVVIQYLKTQNLHKVDLADIAWRYKADKAFYTAATPIIRSRGYTHHTLNDYALLYRDNAVLPAALTSYPHLQTLMRPYFKSPTYSIDAADYEFNTYQHFEYAPLINARAHQLKSSAGAGSAGGLDAAKIQNVQFRNQYKRFLDYLLYRSSKRARIPAAQQLAAVYYLLLQERNDEAVQFFAAVDLKAGANVIPAAAPYNATAGASAGAEAKQAPAPSHAHQMDRELSVQYDYLRAYLDFFAAQGPTVALALAKQYANYPVLKKRALFQEISDQIFEAAPPAAGSGVTDNLAAERKIGGDLVGDAGGSEADRTKRDREMANLAATEPAIDMTVTTNADAKAAVAPVTIDINYANVPQLTLNFYSIDLEQLFSTSPFTAGNTGSGNNSKPLFVSPNFSQTLQLAKDKTAVSVPLPAQFANANIFVEAVAAVAGASALTRLCAYYSNSLSVQVIEQYGQIKVTHRSNGKPLPTTYVKVYGKDKSGGAVTFYKDGYTDARGRFDFASLSTNKLQNVERFSILVFSDNGFGAVVREAAPPSNAS